MKVTTRFILISLALAITHQSPQSAVENDILQVEIDQFHKKALELLEESHQKLEEDLGIQFGTVSSNICTGGKFPNKLTLKQYLKAFAQGPCTPVTVVPGILSSKLVAKIDCQVLQKTDPETFAACGWKGCTGRSKPSPEYFLWVPELTSPASLLKPSLQSKKCFAGLFGFKVKGSGNGLRVTPKPGVSVDTYGSTRSLGDTADTTYCGFRAIENMVPHKFGIKGTFVFAKMRELFENAGYINGLTMQALPYDFRLDLREDLLNQKFGRVVNEMVEMTGKKVTIVAHSFGNHHVLNYLWNLSQKEKDAKIMRYIALAPPLGGAIKTMQTALGMDSSFSKKLAGYDLGFSNDFFFKAGYQLKGLYNLYPQNAFNQHRNKPFMKAILSKIEAEKEGKDPKRGTIMDIFPPLKEDCVVGFKERADNCFLGMTDMVDFGSIAGTKITYENIGDILDKHSYSKDSGTIYRQAVDTRFSELKNPGVQVNIVYSAAVQTHSRMVYKASPKTKTNSGNIYEPEKIEMAAGDGSVLTSSALVAGIKWADEFQNQRLPNSNR